MSKNANLKLPVIPKIFFLKEMKACLTVFLLSMILFLLVIPAQSARATIWYVDDDAVGPGTGTSTDPFPTIQQGINAIFGSKDSVSVAPGLYKENITMTTHAKVYGAGAGSDPLVHSIIDGQSAGSVVVADGITGAILDGFTIRNGYLTSVSSGGGILILNSDIDIRNCIIKDNYAAGSGGGIHCQSSSSVEIFNCIFDNNTGGYGGGLSNYSSSPNVEECLFLQNTSNLDDGGGMRNTSNSNPTVNDCTFRENHSHWGGGAMYNNNSSPVITDCDFFDNTSNARPGGGIYNFDAENIEITDCFFEDNESYNNGGGAISNVLDCNIVITNTEFIENIADGPGGAIEGGSFVSAYNCIFLHNIAYTNGGAASGNLYTVNCTFAQNLAYGDGGGIYGSPVVTNSILWNNNPNQIAGGAATVNYSNIEGGHAGTNNINQDPVFVDLANDDIHLNIP